MYDSYDYNDNSGASDRPLTQAELKAKKIADKRAYKEQKKALQKQLGMSGAKKFFITIGLAAAFGIVAALAFKGSNIVLDKFFPAGKIAEINVNQGIDFSSGDYVKASQLDEIIKNKIDDVVSMFSVDGNKLTIDSAGFSGNSVADVAKKAMPGIVAITNKSIQEIPSFYGLGVQKYESESGGSGIIIGQNDTELLIVTNAHVVSSANTLTVMFVDSEACEAQVKGTDTQNDIAVIAVALNDIKGSTLDAITTCKIGNSDNLRIGEQVVAIGNALGYGQSVTTGIVSALDRPIGNEGAPYIQTDAAINPGNSGGALLNMNGELIGINTAKLASQVIEGMGYAIPISSAKPIIDDLMYLTTRERIDEKEAGYLGISGLSVTQDISARYNIPIGVYIQEVTKGAAADKAGIKSGDVIIKFDGMSMDSMAKLKERLMYYKAGETVDVIIKRSNEGEYVEKTLTVTLDSREGTVLDPDNAEIEVPEDNGNSGGSNKYEYFPDSIFDIFGF